jgi:hypothetical protein
MKKLIYHDRYYARDDGHIENALTGKVLSGGKNSRGYLTVSLYDGSTPKRPKSFLVHRLVAEAFLGESGLQINHKDGNKTNNEISNLEFVTAKENTRHSIEVLGNDQFGTNSPVCKLSEEAVKDILSSDLRNADLGRKYNVHPAYVGQIRKGLYRARG